MNILDFLIVAISMWELFTVGSTNKKQLNAAVGFRTLRIFRALRVLRVTKLFKAVSFILVIVKVISHSISSFFYIAFLLVLFIVIYALMGIQLFQNKLNFENRRSRSNFDSVFQAILSIFQVLTLEGEFLKKKKIIILFFVIKK